MTMAELKAALAALRDHIPPDRPVVFLDYPLHLNVGDLLIWLGAERFLAANGYRVAGRGVVLRADLRRRITPETTILFHGGGNLGDLYPRHQRLREQVIAAFPRNKIVLLPQTAHFADPARAREAAAVFSRHTDLLVLVRDLPSLAIVTRQLGSRAILAPDMAHFLWGEFDTASRIDEGALHLIRRDIEAAARPDAATPAEGQEVDWRDLIPTWLHKTYRAIEELHKIEIGMGHDLGGAALWQAYCHRLGRRMAALFARHRTIVTNRLHACILGALLERRVEYFDNSYGKVGAYAEAWMADLPNIVRLSSRLNGMAARRHA